MSVELLPPIYRRDQLQRDLWPEITVRTDDDGRATIAVQGLTELIIVTIGSKIIIRFGAISEQAGSLTLTRWMDQND